MKTSVRFILALSMFVAVVAPASAQITVSVAQMDALLTAGLTYVLDSTTTSLNIGKPGANATWDFSALKSNNSVVLANTSVTGTPYAAQRPGATNAMTGAVRLTYSGSAVDATAWRYFKYAKNQTAGTAVLGVLGDMAKGKLGGLLDVFGEWVNAQPDTMYSLPIKYQGKWNSSYTDTALITLATVPVLGPTIKTHKVSYTVDAYGIIKLPGGKTDQGLRIKRVDSSSTGPGLTYVFVSEHLGRVEVTAKDPSAPDSGLIDLTIPTIWNAAMPTAVETSGGIPRVYGLSQNYPNPFNPSTVISWQLPSAGEVKLAVYDLLGREVATLVDRELAPGTYTASFNGARLASGVYIYRLTAGQYVEARKMMLTK
jgi:hypothetical protein